MSGTSAGGRPSAAQATELKVGDPAPDFSLAGSDGKTYKLADFSEDMVAKLEELKVAKAR